ncbi:hypothetical protein [Paraburkholderia bannensis]|uniref:hypothetical protein n=1 Tax=Paraburkholderia bannensis TaxID=765414 RepID=UPI002ABD3C86|nr:hypothetical protein [Paraburkholderia bannensis]
MRFLLYSVPDARNRFVPYRQRTIPVHGDRAARRVRSNGRAHNGNHYIETCRNAMNNKKATCLPFAQAQDRKIVL